MKPNTQSESNTPGAEPSRPGRRAPKSARQGIRAAGSRGTSTRRSGGAREAAPASAAPHNPDTLRWIALGGLEEIGRNMMLLEYRDEILAIDAGLLFATGEETPGVDYIIPNTTYLEERKKNIKALIITHAHYDHIGAIPHIMDKIGNPLIYTTQLSKEIIMKRQEDYPAAPKPRFNIVTPGETHQLGKYFAITLFDVVHNIPEGFGMIIRTPIGNIVHPGEFKFDYDHDGKPKGLDIWKRVGEEGIHTLMLDSTGAERPGYALSERVVEAEIEKLFRAAPGRILVGTFASLLDRLGEIVKIAEKLGRHVAVTGRSMSTNLQIAQNLHYFKFEKGTIIPLEEIGKYRDDKLVILCTGAQGEPKGALMRIATGEHRQLKVRATDTVVLSSSAIPGNERSVQNLKDGLARQGATVYHNMMLDIHSSGHAPTEELKEVMRLVKPRFFLPIHGYYFMRWRNARHAEEALGMKQENTLLADNGFVVEFGKDFARVTNEEVPSSFVMVDGLGVGDVGEVVLRDRKTLAEEGMLVIIITLTKRDGRILKNPDIISRGFIYLKDNHELVEEIRAKIKNILGRIPRHQSVDSEYAKTLIRDQVGQFIFTKTKRRPMLLPVLIEV